MVRCFIAAHSCQGSPHHPGRFLFQFHLASYKSVVRTRVSASIQTLTLVMLLAYRDLVAGRHQRRQFSVL